MLRIWREGKEEGEVKDRVLIGRGRRGWMGTGAGRSVQERFEVFHLRNPQVYARLVQMARHLKGRGYEKVGMKMLFEVIRWETMLETEAGSDPFKLNNVYTSRYARLIMEREADLEGIFDLRELKAA